MLKLIYSPAMPGPPADYGAAEDLLSIRTMQGDRALQRFPKADPDFIGPGPELAAALDDWLAVRPDPAAPVIVLVHGYLYDPATDGGESPFDTVYSVPGLARPFNLSWLPLAGECDDAGQMLADNAIAFAYKSTGSLGEFAGAGWDNSYQLAVFDLAPLAGRALAAVFAHLGTRPGLVVRVLAHSLGTRTTSRAVGVLGARMPANLDRMILLDGAEFSVDAAANFTACAFDVVNIVNHADTVLLLGATKMCHAFRPAGGRSSCVIGRDGLGANPRWLDLRIDDPAIVAWLAGSQVPGGAVYAISHIATEQSHEQAKLGHWSCYTNPGNRAFLHDLLFNSAMTVGAFAAGAVPPMVGSPANGLFQGERIPAIPADRAGRQALLRQAGAQLGGASG